MVRLKRSNQALPREDSSTFVIYNAAYRQFMDGFDRSYLWTSDPRVAWPFSHKDSALQRIKLCLAVEPQHAARLTVMPRNEAIKLAIPYVAPKDI